MAEKSIVNDVRSKDQFKTEVIKWASCSTNGWVCFSTDLLKESRDFQNYVIVHELLHLQAPNHGKLFKSLLSAYLPGWEKGLQKRNGNNGRKL